MLVDACHAFGSPERQEVMWAAWRWLREYLRP